MIPISLLDLLSFVGTGDFLPDLCNVCECNEGCDLKCINLKISAQRYMSASCESWICRYPNNICLTSAYPAGLVYLFYEFHGTDIKKHFLFDLFANNLVSLWILLW